MSTVKVDVESLHFEHVLWRNELNFFEDELKIFEHRLEDLVRRVSDNGTLAELEHFQNQFIRQREVLDELKHEIRVHDQMLAQMLQVKKEPTERDLFQHNKVDEQLATYRKIYSDLKADFFRFLVRNL